MNHTTISRLTLALCLALLAGCSHYEWSSEANESPDNASEVSPVAVQTIASRASEGMQTERLTREFVETLQAQGMGGARWSEVAGEDYVQCVVSETDVTGFGKQWSASARVECSVRCRGTVFQVERGGKSMRSGSDRADEIPAEHRAQAESAARRALRKSAIAIATRCEY